MEIVQAYRAFDGAMFTSEAECRAHEMKDPKRALVGLTTEDIERIMAREPEFQAHADAIEILAHKIKTARLGAGERKRAPNGSGKKRGAAASAPPAPPSEAAEG